VTVLPITSLKKGRRVYPNEAVLDKDAGGLPRKSIIPAHQIRTISKKRLIAIMGAIDKNEIKEAVSSALRVHLNL